METKKGNRKMKSEGNRKENIKERKENDWVCEVKKERKKERKKYGF